MRNIDAKLAAWAAAYEKLHTARALYKEAEQQPGPIPPHIREGFRECERACDAALAVLNAAYAKGDRPQNATMGEIKTRQPLIDAYHAAMREEQALYVKVKGHGPGMNGYKPQEWQDWLAAVRRTAAASKDMRDGFDDPGSMEPSS